MANDRLVLITGATGQQGGAVAHELIEKGWQLRAMTRKPDSPAAQALKARGVEIVQGDLNDEASLARPLDGAWGTLAVQNTWEAGVDVEEEQGHRFAQAAKKAGVQHFVYQSVGSAHRNTGIPHFDNKFRIEETVRGLNFPSHVIIRPVFFMENLSSPNFKPSIDTGTLAIGIKPDTKLQSVAVSDIGKYGALAFEKAAELNGRAIDLASDELTGPQMAQVLSDKLGRPINFFSVPIEQIRSFSEEYAVMLEWFDAVGYDADITGTALEYGIAPTRFPEWVPTQSW